METKIIGFVNQKGGVAKTTCALNLSYGLARNGYNVLMIDFDAQANLTASILEKPMDDKKNVGDWLEDKAKFSNIMVSVEENLDLLPAGINLADVEMRLMSKTARERQLMNAIGKRIPNVQKYDFIVIDAKPDLATLTVNVLTACDEIIVPMKAEFFSLAGMKQLIDTVETVREEGLNPDLKINGFVFTMYDIRRKSSSQMVDVSVEFASKKKIKIYDQKIRNLSAIADATLSGKCVYDHAPKSNASKDYEGFVNEFLSTQKNLKKGRN